MMRATPTSIGLTSMDLTPPSKIKLSHHDCISEKCKRSNLKSTLRITINLADKRAYVWCKECDAKYSMFVNKSHSPVQILDWYTQWYKKVWELKDGLIEEWGLKTEKHEKENK